LKEKVKVYSFHYKIVEKAKRSAINTTANISMFKK
jgi:hypothetical protein